MVPGISLRRENTEEKVYRSIIRSILHGEIRPGEFLLEEELSTRLNVSRTPVSRSLMRLVSEGFLEKLPKKGCFVPIPTPQDAEQVYRARMIVETMTAADAAKLAEDDEIAELERLVAMDQDAAVSLDKESYSNINEALHLGIARMARNAYLERWCRYIFWRSNLYIFYLDSFYIARENSDVQPQKTPWDHKEIVEAIRKRDSFAAQEAMRRHLEHTYIALFGGEHCNV